MQLTLSKGEGKIVVSGNTYPYRNLFKFMPGHSWDPEHKVWTFPYTTEAYQALVAALPGCTVESTLVDLIDAADAMQKALSAKDASELGDFDSATSPWLHQKQAFWFAYHRLKARGGAMLALDMGTGKSKVAIDLINNLLCKKVLITCPMSVLEVWQEEFQRHSIYSPHEVFIANRDHGVERRTAEAVDFMEERLEGIVPIIIVINHEGVWREPFATWALSAGFDMVIVDECHRAKLASGKLSRYLHRLSKRVKYRLGLTGTPCPHDIDDFYAQARFIDDQVHGTNHQVYKSEYLLKGGYGNYQTIGFKNVADWNKKFHEMAIQVKIEDVLDLPDGIHTNRYCELEQTERVIYDSMKKEMVADVKSGVITAANALVKLLRLSQIVQGTTKDAMENEVVVGESKRKLLQETFEDIDLMEPLVVFCRFKCDLKTVRTVASACGRQSFELSGEFNELADWKRACSGNGGPVIAVQIQAGGVGISMVQARYCIYLSKDFNLGAYEQSLARVLRPGQHSAVTYIHLVAKNTIDETINSALAKRKNAVEEILAEMGR